MIKPHISSSVLARLLDTTSSYPFERPTFGNWFIYWFYSPLSVWLTYFFFFSLSITEAEAEEYSYSLDKPKEHEAGYDSFITGVCFVTMANYIQIDSCDISEKSSRLRHILNKWVWSKILKFMVHYTLRTCINFQFFCFVNLLFCRSEQSF